MKKQIKPKPGQESAWDYSRPPRLEKTNKHLIVEFDGIAVAETSRVSACFVNGERVKPQEGDFYGGWITSDIVGPFKGGAGTWGW